MKTNFFSLFIILLIFSADLSAQVVSKDSISVLNNEKEQLKIGKTLNENKLKLAKLENQVQGKTNEMYQAKTEAEKAAIENQNAANDLSSDPQNNKKAKDAKKAGSRAESRAKKANKAAKKLEDLNSDIEDLKKKITDDEQKLDALGRSRG